MPAKFFFSGFSWLADLATVRVITQIITDLLMVYNLKSFLILSKTFLSLLLQ